MWVWECTKPIDTNDYKQSHAPIVLFVLIRSKWQTEIHVGWSAEGTKLYNDVLEELKANCIRLDEETLNMGDGSTMTKIEF